MRVDVHERLEAAAKELLEVEDIHVVLVSRPVADTLRVWSEPMQVMVEPGRGGLLEMICRNLDTTREDAVREP